MLSRGFLAGRRSFPVLRTSCSRISSFAEEQSTLLNSSLKDSDSEIYSIIQGEKKRQIDNLVMIASENYTSKPVLEALGSVMQNKYSEGYPGARYYGGTEFVDMAESLCQKRALEAFRLDPAKWGVNVQPLSGSPSNFIVYTGLIEPNDRILALDLPHGGHLSHGYQLPKKKISMVSKFFQTFAYRLREETGLIDYDMVDTLTAAIRPRIIVAGASSYARLIDYERMKKAAESVDGVLLGDMAHISGLVAANVIPSPFDYCDVVTTTTHKSLRGPRGAMIFYRKGIKSTDKKGNAILYDYEERINSALFPGLQGGPHNHTITALAVALKQAASPEFVTYQKQVLANAKALAKTLQAKGHTLVSGGTDNHLILDDLRPFGIDGAKAERVLELCGIVINKNTVPGDTSALKPGGIRIGTPALTSRGLLEKDIEQVAGFIAEAVKITVDLSNKIGGTKLKDFTNVLDQQEFPAIRALRDQVTAFSRNFPAIGQ